MFKKVILFSLFFSYLLKAQENYNKNLESKSSVTKITEKEEELLKDVLKYDSNMQRHDLKSKKTYLTQDAKVEYEDIKIEADYIEIIWDTNEVYAKGKLDQSGVLISPALFFQGKEKKQKVEYHSFLFNFKTRKGISYNVRTEIKEGVILAKRVKQNQESIKLMKDVLFTTDDYYKERKDKEPDFYLKTDKLKYIEKKSAISGPLWVYIYKSPLPVPLPFFYLPLGNKNSGIHVPTIQEFTNRGGLSFQGLGFYWAISDYLDSDTKGDIYLNGGFRVDQTFRFKKRYTYDGNATLSYTREIQGIKGLEDPSSYYKKYNKETSYQIRLRYSQDPKYSPSLGLNIDINYSGGGKNFDRLNPSLLNPQGTSDAFLRSQANSSITLTKKFEKFNDITLRANLDQDFHGEKTSFLFPQITTNYNKNPFRGSENSFLKTFQFDYRFNLENRIDKINNEDFFTKKIFEQIKSGIVQEINLSSSKVFLEHFNFSPKLNYYENWVLHNIQKVDDSQNLEGKEERKNGFKTFRTFDIGAGLNTTITKLKTFENRKLLALRHKVVPRITFIYTPDFSSPFWGYYKEYNGKKYNVFSTSLNGSSINNHSSRRLDIYLNNNLEIKIRDEKEAKKSRKIKILERFDLSTSYNFEKEEFKWSTIKFSGNTPLIKNSSINYNFTIDPYKKALNEKGENQRINQLGGFYLDNFSTNLRFGLDQNTFSIASKKKQTYSKKGQIRYEKFFFDKNNYARYEIPWNLNFDINYNYSKNNLGSISHSGSLNLSGNVSPTPYWSIDISSNYSFSEKKISILSLSFKRDIRSFIMRFSWSPIATGPIRTWGFNIGFKPSILSSIKFNRRNEIGE